jgi:hypothetical protein
MTPKEKAEELVNQFLTHTRVYNDEFGWEDDIESAKKCALIAVDELIKLSSCFEITDNYWEKVKKEIEKL